MTPTINLDQYAELLGSMVAAFCLVFALWLCIVWSLKGRW